MQTSFASLRFALALAVFLVYLVMAATFESLVHPFVVLFTIPLALVGVVLGILITGIDVSVIALIGVVMLVGIVVNNAIVLIDTVNQLRRGGMAKLEAVIARRSSPPAAHPHDHPDHRPRAAAHGAVPRRGRRTPRSAGHHGLLRARC